jgi:hypothetical protein
MSDLRCRHCGSTLQQAVIDLGHQPPSNAYLTADDAGYVTGQVLVVDGGLPM